MRTIYLREVKPHHFALFNEHRQQISETWRGKEYATKAALAWVSSWPDMELIVVSSS